MRGLQERPGGVRIQIIDQRVQAIFRVSSVGAVDVAGRGAAEDMPHQHDLPAAFGRRGPLDLAIADGERFGIAGRDTVGERPRRKRPESAGRRGHGKGLSRRHPDADVRHDSLHTKQRIVLADFAAGETAGITALVRQPDFHAALAGLFDGKPGQREMLRRQVFRGHASRRSEVHDVDAVPDQRVEFAGDSLARQFAAPDGPMDGAVFAGRRGEVGGHLADRGLRHLLPGPLRQER